MQNGQSSAASTDLDKRVADVMKDIEKDDDFTDADEHDPALLAELQEITGAAPVANSAQPQSEILLPTTLLSKIEMLKARIQMYERAELAARQQTDESSRARRFNRGIQTLNELLKQAQNGKDFNVDEIPPEVSMKNVQSVEDGGDATAVGDADKVGEKKSS